MLETSLFVTTLATLAMMSPGPDFFLVIRYAARYRYPVALMAATGVTFGVITHMSYCVAGLAIIITTTPWLFNVLKYAGALYLIIIGIQALIARSNRRLDLSGITQQDGNYWQAFIQGYLCNLLNPKATLFFLSVFTQVLSVDSSLGEKLWYALIIVLLATAWWPTLVFLIQSAPVRRRLENVQQRVDKLLGGILIILGIKIAIG